MGVNGDSLVVKKDNKEILYQVLKCMLIICVVAICFPGDAFLYISGGIDYSGIYAFNALGQLGFRWGTDAIFTYGPLGFLSHCMNVGNNIVYFLVFWIACSILHAYILRKLLQQSKGKYMHIIVAMFFLISGRISLEGAWAQYYICYLAILFILCAKNYDKKAYIITNLLFCISFYMKTSSAIFIFSAMILFTIGECLNRSENRKYYFLGTILAPIEVVVGYLFFYNHSFNGLISYLIGCVEEASGYNSAMSVNISDAYGIWVIVIIVCYVSIMALLYKKTNANNFLLLCTFLGPLFFSYKHGFVRSDHYLGAFSSFMIMVALLIMFIDYQEIKQLCAWKRKLFVISAVIPIFIGISAAGKGVSDSFAFLKRNVLSIPPKIQGMTHQDLHSAYQLPGEVLNRIGDDTVTIYSWEISYAAFNDINYVPIPGGIQPYNMYTTHLDKMSACFFDDESAPQWIIMTLDTIDNRWALLECPQTWFSIKNNYHIDYYEDGIWLMRRNDIPVAVNLISQDKREVPISSPISIEDNGYIKIKANLSVLGKLVNLFWKIPEVNMQVVYKDGHIENHRVLLNCFSEGVYVKSIVCNEDTFVDAVNGEGKLSNVDTITFSGEGLKYYKSTIIIESFDVQYENIESYSLDSYELWSVKQDIPEYEIKESDIHYNIEAIEETDEYTHMTGWAFSSEENEECDIYVECDGNMYIASMQKRVDVKDAYNLENEITGFSLLIPEKVENCYIYIVDHQKKKICRKQIF